MKKFILGMALASLLGAQGAMALTVNHLSFDLEHHYLLAQVSFKGCGKHRFKLKMGMCTRSLPPTCHATLIDQNPDQCVQKQVGTVVLPFADYGFAGPMWNGAGLVVTGSPDGRGGAGIRFPWKSTENKTNF